MAVARLTIGGTLIANQRWSIGVSLVQSGALTTPSAAEMGSFAQQAYADFLSAAWNTAASGAQALNAVVGSASNVDQARAYFYGTSSTAQVVGQSTGAAVPGATSRTQPGQVAIVCSLLTGLAGRSNRGRLYLPNGTINTGADGNLSTALLQGIANSIANWLSLLRTRSLGGSTVIPVVASATGPGVPITTVRVDSVADTQRRRRDKIAPTVTRTASLIVG